ncbi:MAG: DUF6316 family protein [Pseudomonadota bacterium]
MRHDDTKAVFYRRVSKRIYCLDGEWYFATREGSYGPFTRREAAEAGLARHLDGLPARAPRPTCLSGIGRALHPSDAPRAHAG